MASIRIIPQHFVIGRASYSQTRCVALNKATHNIIIIIIMSPLASLLINRDLKNGQSPPFPLLSGPSSHTRAFHFRHLFDFFLALGDDALVLELFLDLLPELREAPINQKEDQGHE